MNSANSRADWIKRSGWAQREPSPPSPQETDFNWDFSTPLPRISRGSSPIPMPINPDPRPDETHEPSPVVSEPDIPIHHFHHQYYFEDAKDEFIVEGYRFRIYRFLFDLQTSIFPRNSEGVQTPIPLDGVTLYEFACLLDFLLDGMHNDRMMTLAGWKSILCISTRYEMTRIRHRAIRELINFEPLIDSVDLVVLAINHQVDHWLPIAYSRLCQRRDTLTVPEGERLGIETVCLLYRAREKIREGATLQNDAVAEPFDSELVHRAVYEVFWPEKEVPKLESPVDSAHSEATNGNHDELGGAQLSRDANRGVAGEQTNKKATPTKTEKEERGRQRDNKKSKAGGTKTTGGGAVGKGKKALDRDGDTSKADNGDHERDGCDANSDAGNQEHAEFQSNVSQRFVDGHRGI